MSECPTLKPVKREIKEAIRDLLKGKTEAKDNVVISQSVPTDEEEVPKILIYSVSEDSNQFHESPKDYKRVMSVVVEIIDRGNNDDLLDAQLEMLGLKVESLIESNQKLYELISDLELKGSSYATNSDGSSYLGSLAISFDITFYENAIRKGSICYPKLVGADVEWEVGPEQETTANDEYTFEQGEEE